MKISIALNFILISGIILFAIRKKDWVLDKINPKRYNVIMVGHSLTGACDWNKELGRSDVKNDGMGGATTFNFMQFVFEDVIRREPKICFLDGGLNDVECGIPLKFTFANYTNIVDSLIKHHIKPVLQSTIYCRQSYDSTINDYADSVNIFLVDLSAKRGIPYVELNQYLSKGRRLDQAYTKDGYHLNAAANKIWAREVKKVLDAEKI